MNGIAALLHQVETITLDWYDRPFYNPQRLSSPRMRAQTKCGVTFHRGRALNEVPSGVSECRACAGTGTNFPRGSSDEAIALARSALSAGPELTAGLFHMPATPGIYMIYRDDVCLYVGSTKNLRIRTRNHEKSEGSTRFAYVECNVSALRYVEQAYIDALNPTLNRNRVHLPS